jgi:hypothetical protein
MKQALLAAAIISLLLTDAPSQTADLTPAKTVAQFYRLLKEKKYVEGFRLSVYRVAVESLKPEELKDLEPDFARTFSGIPDKLEAAGEQITGDTATVFIKFKGSNDAQQIGLVKVDGQWLVGDKESLDLVRAQGATYFFNARVAENENEIYRLLLKLVGAEMLYQRRFGNYATIEELIKLSGVPKDIQDSAALGYRITFSLNTDKSVYYAQAVPVAYGKTGKLSFYADGGGIRAEDLKGGVASPTSPPYPPR